jgi:hypothetical protein
VSLVLAGATACSGSADQSSGTPTSQAPPTPESSASESSASESSASESSASVEPPLPQLTATQVVDGLTAAGYTCGKDSTYAICESGPVAVWVLTGKHKRVPVVSLHSGGRLETAYAAIVKELPNALRTAHIRESHLVADWFGKQSGKEAGRTTIGDWFVELSAEVDSEEPGVHLTLTDKFCKANCQAE